MYMPLFRLTGQWDRKALKWMAIVIVFTLFLVECLVAVFTMFTWNVPIARSQGSVKVLFVADPQIQGYQHELAGVLGYITRWDVCRYLKTTFSYTMWVVQPDVVVFLGDLLDEGYISSDENFLIYKKWFQDIYQVPSSVKTIHLAGDNDVGGEAEPLLWELLKRHEKHFGPTNQIVQLNNWQFLKLNTISFLRSYHHDFDEKRIAKNLEIFLSMSFKKLAKQNHTIVLSHLPVYFWDTDFAIKVLGTNPKAIFSGHLHKPNYRKYVSNGFSVNEHVVPTCSYRMGTTKMGMGVAILEPDGSYQYTVLKLPARYFYLYLYIVVLCCCILYLCIFGRVKLKKALL